MFHRVKEHQTVGQLKAGGEDMRQKGDTAHDPTPSAVRVEMLKRKKESLVHGGCNTGRVCASIRLFIQQYNINKLFFRGGR